MKDTIVLLLIMLFVGGLVWFATRGTDSEVFEPSIIDLEINKN